MGHRLALISSSMWRRELPPFMTRLEALRLRAGDGPNSNNPVV